MNRSEALKRFLSIALCVLCSLLIADSGALAAGMKVGVVNAAELLEKAPQAERATQRLKKEFATRENGLINSQKEIKRLEDRLARDGAMMSEAEQRKLERRVLSEKRDLKRAQDEFRDDLNFRRNEELAKLQTLVNEAIEQIGKESGYDLILYEGIAYANPKIDLTDQVLNRLKRGR
jgi:outer membrane protein